MLTASGAPRGSLYHHFPGGKDELVLAALQLAGERMMGSLESVAGRPAPEIAQTFIGLWRSVLEASGFGAGCAIVAVTVAADTPTLIEKAEDIFRAARLRLAALLVTGGGRGAPIRGIGDQPRRLRGRGDPGARGEVIRAVRPRRCRTARSN